MVARKHIRTLVIIAGLKSDTIVKRKAGSYRTGTVEGTLIYRHFQI